MVKTIGVFADKPTAATGMAVVCDNLAGQLAKKSNLRVVYFGRFGWDSDKNRTPFAPEEQCEIRKGYEYVPTEGGVWNVDTVREAIKTYKLDTMFSEDDWFSASGLVRASKMTDTPFHFLTPIDSLPIHKNAFNVFKSCEKVYVPNRSYQKIPNGVYLPHGCNTILFQPQMKNQTRIPRFKNMFTFLWIGRNEVRKAMGRAILAFMQMYDKVENVQMVIRSDWKTGNGEKTGLYLSRHKELPIIRDQMRDFPHASMQQVYYNCDVLIITTKAGGFELQSLEAQACGLPVLVTDWTFMNETVVDGKSGFLIDIDATVSDPNGLGRIWGNISIDTLAKKMLWCAQHQKQVKIMGNWGRKNVQENYQWEKIADKLYWEMGFK